MEKRKLINDSVKDGVPWYWPAYVEQFKVYLETIKTSSEARRSFHLLFVTINSTILGLVIGVPSILVVVFGKDQNLFERIMIVTSKLMIVIGVAGIVASLIWLRIVTYYRLRSKEGLCLLSEAEGKLPLSFFTVEYDRMRSNGTMKRLAGLLPPHDLLLPWYFIVVYLAMPFTFRWVLGT